MTRMMRKYKTWLMVGFGILLMLAFLGGPMIQELQGMQRDRVVGKLDGKAVRAGDLQTASKEIAAFSELGNRMPFFNVGIPERDMTHWLLLTREAQAAGFIGEEANGEEYLDLFLPQMARQYMDQALQTGADPALREEMIKIFMEQDPQRRSQMRDQLENSIAGQFKNMTIQALGQAGLNSKEIGLALARFAGVQQMRIAYASAPRVSSRALVSHGKEKLDAVTGDFLFIPALKIAGEIPEPTAEQLQAHFERFRTVKPGEGEYGIGYLLPPRIKLETLKLDRAAIAAAIELDPVEVRKAHQQNKTMYPGDFASERPRVEERLRGEKAERVMAEAQAAVQREVQKATRRLESRQKYRVLPPDWEQQRPRLADVAQAVVAEVKAATGVTIPTPEVQSHADGWLTQEDLYALPGIGTGGVQQGGLQARFPEVAFWTRELEGETGFLPIQQGLPLVDNFVRDAEGNRYFFTVLGTRQESAPDSVADLGQEAVEDYKRVAAFEQIQGQIEQVERAAEAEGLDQLVQTFQLQPAPAEGTAAPASPLKQDVRVQRIGAGVADPALQDQQVRDAIVDAAGHLDPLTPPEQWPADAATSAVPAPRQLGIAVFRARKLDPLTVETVRLPAFDMQLTNDLVREEFQSVAETDPFSLESLLKRHVYVLGDRRISSVEELRRGDEES